MSVHYASVCRIAQLEGAEVVRLPQDQWARGDYVLTEVVAPPGMGRSVELGDGRHAEVDVADQIVGALGTRAATLELTGSWQQIGPDGRLHLLTAAGLLGKLTSRSPFIGWPIDLAYRGHLVREGRRVAMHEEAAAPRPTAAFDVPVVLVVGSSMSAGKTASARKIIRRLKSMGQRVVAGKLTGAARYRDALSMRDAGADAIFDFVDAGLPSTVTPEADYRAAVSGLLGRMGAVGADVAVIEAGASPLEPYNGAACLDLLGDRVAMVVLCASDPYSVLGIMHAFERQPDVVAGIATNTDAGRELIGRLTGLPALRLVHQTETPRLDALLQERVLPRVRGPGSRSPRT